MIDPEKIREALVSQAPVIQGLMDHNYENVANELNAIMGDNVEDKVNYTVTLQVRMKVDRAAAAIDTDVLVKWPRENGSDSNTGSQVLLDKPIEDPLPGFAPTVGLDPESKPNTDTGPDTEEDGSDIG